MSWGVSPWVYSVWDPLGFLDLVGYFLSHFREVSNSYLLKYFLMPFLFVFFFWDSYDLNVGVFNIVPEVSEVVLISFQSVFFSGSFISTILSSTSLILSSASVGSASTVGSLQSAFDLSYCIIRTLLSTMMATPFLLRDSCPQQ